MATKPLLHVTKRSNSSDSIENTTNKKFASATRQTTLVKNECVTPKPEQDKIVQYEADKTSQKPCSSKDLNNNYPEPPLPTKAPINNEYVTAKPEQEKIVQHDANKDAKPRSSNDFSNNYSEFFCPKSFLFEQEATWIQADFEHESIEDIRQMVAYVWRVTRGLKIPQGTRPIHEDWPISFLMDRKINMSGTYSPTNPLIPKKDGLPIPQFVSDFQAYVQDLKAPSKQASPNKASIVQDDAKKPRSSQDFNNKYPEFFNPKSFLFEQHATMLRKNYFPHESEEDIRQMISYIWMVCQRLRKSIEARSVISWTRDFLLSIRDNMIEPYSSMRPLIPREDHEPTPQFVYDFQTYVQRKIESIKPPSPHRPSTSGLNRIHEIKFIQEVFPNMSLKQAYMALDMVNTHIRKRTGRENEIVEFIISHKLNSDHAIESDEEEEMKAVEEAEFNLDEDFAKITAIIGDCDPGHIFKELNLMRNDPNRVEKLLTELLEKRNYPRISDQVAKKNKLSRVESLLNMKLDKEEFVQMYPEPREHFYKTDAVLSESYRAHCLCELKNAFGFITEDSILDVMMQNKFHYAPSFRQLEEAFTFQEESLKTRIKNNVAPLHASYTVGRAGTPWSVTDPDFVKALTKYKKVKFVKKGKTYKLENVCRPKVEYPNEPDEYFYRERLYVKHQREIDDFVKTKTQMKQIKFEAAKQQGQLIECQCCFDNELLSDDMLACPGGHAYCKGCIKRYAEVSIGDCKYSFDCIDEKCALKFDMSVLKAVLEPKIIENLLKNIQNEEIRNAGISNLESCPYCNYAAIIENPNEKIFSCLNPSCMKETCRLCQEPNHLPQRCDEVEKKSQVDMRTYIENKVNEAMIRVCYKCQKRFYKTEGCNMMHCVCGASMCYICREPIKGYDHFSKPGGCLQQTDVAELHKIEMEKAYKEATELYAKEHKEAQQILLTFDPKVILDQIKKEIPLKPA